MKNIDKARNYHCTHRDAVVLKVIRQRRLQDLTKIKDISRAPIKFVQMIRDPRAMFRSRSGFGVSFYENILWTEEDRFAVLGLEAYDECEGLLSQLRFVNKTLWLHQKYMDVDHTKLSLNSQYWIQKIYDFIGLSVVKEVTNWLNHKVDEKEKKFAEMIEGSLNTHKDSSEIVKKWYTFAINKMRNIDSHCGGIIRLRRYKYLTDAEMFPRAFVREPQYKSPFR